MYGMVLQDLVALALGLTIIGLPVVAGVSGVRELCTQISRTRHGRVLTRSGVLRNGYISVVEDMDRSVNDAAGHPVIIDIEDGRGGRREVRDASGLGGYFVREGTEVGVRCMPDDAEVLRVDTIYGPLGGYSPHVRLAPLAGLRRYAPAIGLCCVPLVALVFVFGLVGVSSLTAVLPGALLVTGLYIVLAKGAEWLHELFSRRRTAEAIGVVTDYWSEVVRAGRSGTVLYYFTVWFGSADGREVHSCSPDEGAGAAPGGRVRVRYDTEYPPRFHVKALRIEHVAGFIVPILIGTAMIVVGSVIGAVFLVAGPTIG